MNFFFGNQRRATITGICALVVVLFLVHLFSPGLIARTTTNFFREFIPAFNALIYLILVLGIVVFAFRLMFRGFFK